MASDITKPAPLFGAAIDIYNANKAFSNIDPSSVTGIPTNPINDIVLSPLGADNIYATNLSDHFSALVLDKKSITAKDSYAKYQLVFKAYSDTNERASVSVTEKTKVSKNVDFGTGNDDVQEKINYVNEFGDKLIVNHQYKTVTSFAKSDHSLRLSSTSLDNLSQVFTAESGSKAIYSAFTHSLQSKYQFNVKSNIGTTKDNIKQLFHYKSPLIKIDSKIINTTTSTDDNATFISSSQTKNVSYINADKNTDNAYALHYDITQYTVNDNNMMKLTRFSFSDNAIAIEAKGVINGEMVAKGMLKVESAYFSLKTTSPTAKALLDLKTDGYGDKSELDGLFSTTTEFKGTDNADTIVIKAIKPLGATLRETGKAVELTVDAGEGDDVIMSSQYGANIITGGDGKDTFVIGNHHSGSIVIKSTTLSTNESGSKTTYDADMKDCTIINDFTTQVDRLSLGTVANKSNYAEGTQSVADFSAALTAATIALKALHKKGERFAFEFDETNGYLFNDINGDGKADQVIVLVGVDNVNISATDITI